MIEGLWFYVGAVLYAFIGVWVEDRWFRAPVGIKAWIMVVWPIALAAVLYENHD